jgi:hypothetical protein
MKSAAFKPLNGKDLKVLQAYKPPPAGANVVELLAEPFPLLYEGRAAIIQVEDAFLVGKLGEACRQLFDFVSFFEAGKIEVSVIETSCQSKVDLAFLVDASDSVTPANFNLATEFVNTVAKRFNFGRDKQQMAMVTYSGPSFVGEKDITKYGAEFGLKAVAPRKPVEKIQSGAGGDGKGGDSNVCPPIEDGGVSVPTFCRWKSGDVPTCDTCAPALNWKCPSGTLWGATEYDPDGTGPQAARNVELCLCRVASPSWKDDPEDSSVSSTCSQIGTVSTDILKGCSGGIEGKINDPPGTQEIVNVEYEAFPLNKKAQGALRDQSARALIRPTRQGTPAPTMPSPT